MGTLLSSIFYQRSDVTLIAKELLGKALITCFDGQERIGIITETEAYAGITDRASHAYGGRYTDRTRIMYEAGGIAYVYLCYGVHSLFNVVTNVAGIPHAVLIRAVVLPGLAVKASKGPGKVSKHLGIHYSHSGLSLNGPEIRIEDYGIHPMPAQILVSKRIGIDYAGPDKDLLYRFEFPYQYSDG